ncbi:hypothetical protein FLX56_17430 [Synechococcus moorigangaii CMS01]|nr:hypothetical protein [Synechococcus moorigangaii CMS01]
MAAALRGICRYPKGSWLSVHIVWMVMLISLLVLGVVVAIALLLFRIWVPRLKGFKQFARRFFPAVGLLILVLGINLAITYRSQQQIQRQAALEPITTFEALQAVDAGQPVAVVAVASPDNPVRGRDNEYLAYVDDNGLWTPQSMLFDLDDTQIAIDDGTYETRNWPLDRNLRFLNPRQQVVIVGQKEMIDAPVGPQPPAGNHSVQSEIIFAGSHPDFLQDLQRRLWGPRLLVGLNAFALGAIALATLITAFRVVGRKSPQDLKETPNF